MLQNSDSENLSGKGRRVLLISGKPSFVDIISALLVPMGYTCSAASNLNALAMLERENFDAVLLDLVDPTIAAEETIVKINVVNPILARRLLVIRDSATESTVGKLIERYGLSHLSQDDLVPKLWTLLQKVVGQPDLNRLPPRYVQPARMIFDSFGSPSPAGVRSLRTSVRQFVYQHERMTIDILLEPAQGSGRMLLTGQVLSAQPNDAYQADLPVLLISGARTLARTTTDSFGEFSLEFEPTVNASLEIRLGEGLWVSIQLGNMERDEGISTLNAAG